jgi:hypothetical protein
VASSKNRVIFSTAAGPSTQFLALQMVKLSSLHDVGRHVDVFYRYRRDALVNALQMRFIDGFGCHVHLRSSLELLRTTLAWLRSILFPAPCSSSQQKWRTNLMAKFGTHMIRHKLLRVTVSTGIYIIKTVSAASSLALEDSVRQRRERSDTLNIIICLNLNILE